MSDARWDGYVAEGRKAVRQRDDAQWRLGDLALEVQTTYGEKDCERYAEAIGVEYDTLRDYRRVARMYNAQNGERSPFLPWSVHRVLAGQDDRAALVEQAAESKWTYRDAQAFLDERKATEQPAAPVSPLERLMQSDSYRAALAESGQRAELDGPKARLGAKGGPQIPNLDIKLERYRAETAWYDESCDVEALTYMDTRALARTGEMAIAVWTEMLDRIARAHRAAAS